MSVCDPGGPSVPWYRHPYFAVALVGVGAFGSSLTLRFLRPEGVLRVAAALLTLPPAAFMVYCFFRWIRGLDELHHRMVFEAVSFAFVVSILAAVALEGLQKAGYDASIRWEDAWAIMMMLYAVGYAIAHRRYR